MAYTGSGAMRKMEAKKPKVWKEWGYNSYVSEFLGLRCAGDVLNIVNPLGTKACKEITESMAIIKRLRQIILRRPMKYTVVDLCAGNALTSVLAVFLFPIKKAMAMDKRPRRRHWEMARNFRYIITTIEETIGTVSWPVPAIVISIHPCKGLAIQVIDLYRRIPAFRHLILMPCCKGGLPKENQVKGLVAEKLTAYERWCVGLASMVDGTVVKDKKCLSPCNCIVTASKNN